MKPATGPVTRLTSEYLNSHLDRSLRPWSDSDGRPAPQLVKKVV